MSIAKFFVKAIIVTFMMMILMYFFFPRGMTQNQNKTGVVFETGWTLTR